MSDVIEFIASVVYTLTNVRDIMRWSEAGMRDRKRVDDSRQVELIDDEIEMEEIISYHPDNWFGTGPDYNRGFRSNDILFTGEAVEVANYYKIIDALKECDYKNLERIVDSMPCERFNHHEVYRNISKIKMFLGDDLYNSTFSYCFDNDYFFPAFYGKNYEEEGIVTIPKKVISTGRLTQYISEFTSAEEDYGLFVDTNDRLVELGQKWQTPILLLNEK